MYLDYWGLRRSPFDNVPDPQMFFVRRGTAENAVDELLFAVTEGNECLAVVVGDVGLGKTMTLRMVLNELDSERYRIAYLTNPDLTFLQLLREVVGQLLGQPCQVRAKDVLLEEFNRLLFESADEGRRVVIFIDEANALRSPSLEGLRLLTNLQEDDRNLLTIILAGQPKLARILRDSRRSNLLQRVGVYVELSPLSSVEEVQAYVTHRLQRSGCSRSIFTSGAVEAIYRHSEGIPRLVNRFSKLALKVGEVRRLDCIDTGVIQEIADRFDLKTRSDVKPARPSSDSLQEETTAAWAAYTPAGGNRGFPLQQEEQPTADVSASPVHEADRREETEGICGETPTEASAPWESSHQDAKDRLGTEPEKSEDTEEERREPEPQAQAAHAFQPTRERSFAPSQVDGRRTDPPAFPRGVEVPRQNELEIPGELIEAVRRLRDERQRMRLAGELAARQIQMHPERYTEASIDPVQTWDELRARILALAS